MHVVMMWIVGKYLNNVNDLEERQECNGLEGSHECEWFVGISLGIPHPQT